MNFQDLQTVEDYQFYLDVAFRRAKDKSAAKKVKGTRLQKTRSLEKLRVQIVHGSITSRLMKILVSFPEIDKLPEFYNKMVKLTLDYPEVKRSLGALNWAVKQCDSLKRKYVQLLSKGEDIKKNSQLKKEFYGRVSSVLKQINKNLMILESARRTMKSYPSIKTSVFTIAICGFPNIGKTTLLSKLTGSTPEIKAYAFTTKGVNVGYINNKKIQFLDTPGTLNRFNKMNNIEKIASLAIDLVADMIIYVFDLTEPFPLEKQEKLLKNLKKDNKPILIYLSKTDILPKETVEEFRKKYDVYTDADQLRKKVLIYK